MIYLTRRRGPSATRYLAAIGLLAALIVPARVVAAPRFRAPTVCAPAARFVAAADVNGDGLEDAVALAGPNPDLVVLLGNGDGTLQEARHAVAPGATELVVGEFTGDNHLDVAVVAPAPFGVTIYAGDAGGGFQPAGTYGVTAEPSMIVAADIDHDGRVDLLTLSPDADTVSILHATPHGFERWPDVAVDLGAKRFLCRDVNHDGFPDLLVASDNDLDQVRITEYLNDRGGGFTPGPSMVFDDGDFNELVDLESGDFNHDGRLDLVVGFNLREFWGIQELLGQEDGTFTAAPRVAPKRRGGTNKIQMHFATITSLAVGDIDHDGLDDVLACSPYGGNFNATGIYVTPSSGVYSTSRLPLIPDSYPEHAAVADFNHDGVLDVVAATGRGVVLMLGPELDLLESPTWHPIGMLPVDLNGDHKLDLVIPYETDPYVRTLLGDGTGRFVQAVDFGDEIAGTYDEAPLAVGDVTGDGRPDLVAFAWDDSLFIEPGDGQGGFGPRVVSTELGVTVAVADLRGDGHLSVLVGNASGVRALECDAAGNVTASRQLLNVPATQSIKTADLDGDGKLDLLIGGTDLVVAMQGRDGFTARPALSTGFQEFAIGPVNRDPFPDLIGDDGTIWLGDGQGGFTRQALQLSAGKPAIGDVDGDGSPDLCMLADVLTVYLGDGTGAFTREAQYLVANSGAPVLSDVDGDGTLDLLAVNFGDWEYYDGFIATVLQNHDRATPTLLTRFQAIPLEGGVEITWQFSVPVARVAVQRADSEAGPWLELPSGASELETGSIVDRAANRDRTCFYRLAVRLRGGSSTIFGPIALLAEPSAGNIAFSGIAPNPSSGRASIRYSSANAGPVRVRVLDLQGRRVATLVDGVQAAGPHQVVWDGTHARAGVYFVEFEAGGRRMTKRVSLAR